MKASNVRQSTVERYTTVLMSLYIAINNGEELVATNFCNEHSVSNYFFPCLVDSEVIKQSAPRVYNWAGQLPSVEMATSLAMECSKCQNANKPAKSSTPNSDELTEKSALACLQVEVERLRAAVLASNVESESVRRDLNALINSNISMHTAISSLFDELGEPAPERPALAVAS